MPRVVYDSHYNIGCWGSDRLHPFDTRKYARSWQELQRTLGPQLAQCHQQVDRPVTDEELLLIHSPEYMARLRSSAAIAAVTEVPLLKRLPTWLLRWALLTPMRWAARGTVLACRAAIASGIAVNLGGGFHHAKYDRGEGFCFFSDIALAIHQLRTEQRIMAGDRIAYIDLDAHQGNGVCHFFENDGDVFIFDLYNADIYPSYELRSRQRIDCDLPVHSGCTGDEYLRLVRSHLPPFLDSISRNGKVVLGIYNAGTDVSERDALGRLSLTDADVFERDHFTLAQFRQRNIPVAMLTSGGYTAHSYQLIANTIGEILRDG
ncbi:Acetoin utilization protein AcuC [Anatilimnocola aggregata]|uniref:Acetoin utilization protein AcuC n=1 Tax=Anatilimnocola aggregata TaxID=2528021 RepID=A0A517YLQ5_9BACT|nr:histone deacetylase [Anatilimnocola aggregata]QDU31143.1 Acetoin utilization protein AcuC [Anatilimnocola aggregata]